MIRGDDPQGLCAVQPDHLRKAASSLEIDDLAVQRVDAGDSAVAIYGLLYAAYGRLMPGLAPMWPRLGRLWRRITG